MNHPKYETGLKRAYVPEEFGTGDVIGDVLGMSSAGANLGQFGGPLGIGIGAGVGGLTGLIKGLLDKKRIERERRFAKENNKYVDFQEQFDIDPAVYIDDDVAPLSYRKGTKGVNPDIYQAFRMKSNTKKKPQGGFGPSPFASMYQNGVEEVEANPVLTEETVTIVKPVEVEKKETVFKRLPGGTFILKADFKGGKSHKDGGEEYLAEDGDVIYPAKDREKVMEAYKHNDNMRLESLRMKLPKDKQSYIPELKDVVAEDFIETEEFKKGTSGINIDPSNKGKFTEAAKRRGMGVQEFARKVLSNKDEYSPLLIKRANFAKNAAKWEKAEDGMDMFSGGDSFGSGLLNFGSDVLAAAPSLYNIGRSIFERPQYTERRLFEPVLEQDTYDVSAQLSDINRQQKLREAQARNLSAGNVGAAVGNISQANSDALRARNSLRAKKFNREQSIRNRNTAVRNMARQRNLELENYYDQLDQQAEANKRAGLAAGLEGLSALGQSRQQTGILTDQARQADKLAGQRNEISLNVLKNMFPDFDFAVDAAGNPTGEVYFRGTHTPVPRNMLPAQMKGVDFGVTGSNREPLRIRR